MLSKNQMRCIELMIEGDMTQKEIAKEIKVSEVSICNWKHNTEFVDEFDRRLRAGVRSLAPKAYKALGKLLTSENEYIRMQAVKDVLDRAGLKPGENVKISGAGVAVIVDDCEQ